MNINSMVIFVIKSDWACIWVSFLFILLLWKPWNHLVAITQCNCFMKLLWVFSFIMTTCALNSRNFSLLQDESLCAFEKCMPFPSCHTVSGMVVRDLEIHSHHSCLLRWKLSMLTTITSASSHYNNPRSNVFYAMASTSKSLYDLWGKA